MGVPDVGESQSLGSCCGAQYRVPRAGGPAAPCGSRSAFEAAVLNGFIYPVTPLVCTGACLWKQDSAWDLGCL